MTTTLQRFTKRPVTIEAAQLTGDTAQWHAIYLWVEANTLGSFEPLDVIEGRKPWPPSGVSIDPRDGRLIISTLEGLHWADEGDWIIRGIQGEFYPCKSAVFDATYERVDDDVTNTVAALQAQVHAPLALAEQQRIANLIALAAMDPDGLGQSAYSALAAMSPDRRRTVLDPDIAAALGIGDDDE